MNILEQLLNLLEKFGEKADLPMGANLVLEDDGSGIVYNNIYAINEPYYKEYFEFNNIKELFEGLKSFKGID